MSSPDKGCLPPRLRDAETMAVQVEAVAGSWTLPDSSRRAQQALFWRYEQTDEGTALAIPVDQGGGRDYERLCARRAVGGPRTIVYLTYENPWGKSGGVESVARMLPKALRQAAEKVIRVSPLHHRLVTAADVSRVASLGERQVQFAGLDYVVHVQRCIDRRDGEEWILFENPEFFDADGGAERRDPYVFSEEDLAARDGADSRLLRDALFASKAVPEVLRVLQAAGLLRGQLVVHLQDWEFAAAALTIKEALLDDRTEIRLANAAVVLTLHNPYDHNLTQDSLRKITKRHADEYWPLVKRDYSETVLARMIPLTDAPVSTVSRVFAQEFTSDPLQAGYFAHHYQDILAAHKIVGIDNGLFQQPSFTATDMAIAAQARQGSAQAILEKKRAARRDLLGQLPRYLQEIAGSRQKPAYGKLSTQVGKPLADLPADVARLPDQIPLFMMVGRLDPGQKGFDVFARAIEAMPVGVARYVISPLSPLAFDPRIRIYLDDLIELATATRPGEVLVLPFLLDPPIYAALRAGVTWSVWPSLYEPFGGVNEFYSSLTPVVARKTGGLIQQVIGYDENPWLASGVVSAEDVHGIADLPGQHRGIQDAARPKGAPGGWVAPVSPDHREEDGTTPDRIERSRTDYPLYQEMVAALARALQLAVTLYQHQPVDYGRILGCLPEMTKLLSWDRSVAEYRRWYDLACRA